MRDCSLEEVGLLAKTQGAQIFLGVYVEHVCLVLTKEYPTYIPAGFNA